MKGVKNSVLGFLMVLLLGNTSLFAQDLKFEPDTTFHLDFDFELSEALAADSLIAFFEGDSISLDLPDANYIPKVHMDVVADRISCMNTQIPLTINKTVCGFIQFFLVRKRNYTQTMLEREGYYFPIFEKYLAKYNLPDELKYLSVVESGLKYDAKSRTGAMGLWQFMPGTGKDFRMSINHLVDERMHIEKATDGACRFLKILYNQFGDWELALAAYNCGPGNVRKAIRNSGGRTFWEVYNHLPQETRSYVPQFTAVVYSMKFAAEHNLYADADSLMRPIEVDTIRPGKHLDLARLEKLLQVDSNVLRQLNPHLSKNIYACNLPYPLCIPAEKKTYYLENQVVWEDSASTVLPVAPTLTASSSSGTWVYHTVKKRESLAMIAGRYNSSPSQIKKWNRLKRSAFVPAGRRLKVQFEPGKQEIQIAQVKKPTQVTFFPDSQVQLMVKPPYIVGKNEGLYAIGRKFEVSKDDLMVWNYLSSENLYEGQSLVVDKPIEKVAQSKPTIESHLVLKPMKDKPEKVDTSLSIVDAESETAYKVSMHTVRKGEGLFSISKKHGVSTKDIMVWNNLQTEHLKVGQILVVKHNARKLATEVVFVEKPETHSKSTQPSEALKFYQVQKGDTIYSITRKYDISAKELIKKNNLKSKVLKPGQKLIVS